MIPVREDAHKESSQPLGDIIERINGRSHCPGLENWVFGDHHLWEEKRFGS